MDSMRRKLISMLTPRERSISGNAPLSFRAKAGDIKSLKQYGKCEQRILPDTYQLYTSVEADGITYEYSSQNLTQIPCKRIADNVFGLYNYITKVFTSATFISSGTPITNPSPLHDIPIVCNNGVLKVDSQGNVYADGTAETINVHGKNLFDPNNLPTFTGDLGLIDHIEATDTGFKCVLKNTVVLNTVYSYYVDIIAIDGQICSCVPRSSSNGDFIIATSSTLNKRVYRFYYYKRHTEPVPQGGDSIYFDNVQIELGSTPTAYEPYYNGGTATAADLLGVGDYKDVQDVIGGGVVRNVGVKVLDGTEYWGYNSNYNCFYSNLPNFDSRIVTTTMLCPYYKYTTYQANVNGFGFGFIFYSDLFIRDLRFNGDVDAFKAFLADQYAAGTPVIVVYPLATPTTESVTPQSLRTTKGNNVVDVDSNVDPVEIEVKYKL